MKEEHLFLLRVLTNRYDGLSTKNVCNFGDLYQGQISRIYTGTLFERFRLSIRHFILCFGRK